MGALMRDARSLDYSSNVPKGSRVSGVGVS